jgi:ATP-dependent DNA helicase RecQ
MRKPSLGSDGAPGSNRPECASSLDWRGRMPRILRRTFGLRRLREGQDAVIASVMSGRPTLAVMPTGAGKSLCYQLPALILDEATVVVSPLIALMKDQCDKLREMGVAAYEFNSAVAAPDLEAATAAIGQSGPKIIFTTPERLAYPSFRQLLCIRTVSLLVIDEAHCISQWGHDFRPAFLEVGGAVERLGRPRVLALTATATAAVIEDIETQLDVGPLALINTGMYRANLHFRVEQVTNESDKLEKAVEFVTSTAGPGLVYTATVKAAEVVHSALSGAGVAAALYHGRLGAAKRRDAQDAFMDGRVRAMVATNAFGLGIDKADTRFVLHYQMPAGLDAYYQEAGRAGRDGVDAACKMLFLHADKAVQQFFLVGKYPSRDDLVEVYRALHRQRGDRLPWTLDLLHEGLKRPKVKLQVAVRLLRHQGVVRQDKAARLSLTRSGMDDGALDLLLEGYRNKRESDRAMLERMVFYGQTGSCRWKVILDNFGEGGGFKACGNCDNCLRNACVAVAEDIDGKRSVTPEIAVSSAPVSFRPGDPVRVPRYGRGTVSAVDAEGVTVLFGEGSSRIFLADFVREVPQPRQRHIASRELA